ncbi:hypothetical protein JXA48_02155 [Candidatus Woesearchaeota archaeon]|nr:hypothetical protein [Candidatus Woesearchaeota archaeon]
MNWLKKSLITAATVFTLQSGFAQTFNYDIRFGMFNTHLGDISYNQEERKLSIDINRFVDISYTYFMPNDSTYIETSENDDLLEKFFYSKKDSCWHLDNYVVIKGESRLDKVALEKTTYNKDVLTPIETLENLISNRVADTNKMVNFGLSYNIFMEEEENNYFNLFYKGNILPYAQDEKDKFLLEDGLVVFSERKGEYFIPKSVDAKTKILQLFNIGARVRRIGD